MNFESAPTCARGHGREFLGFFTRQLDVADVADVARPTKAIPSLERSPDTSRSLRDASRHRGSHRGHPGRIAAGHTPHTVRNGPLLCAVHASKHSGKTPSCLLRKLAPCCAPKAETFGWLPACSSFSYGSCGIPTRETRLQSPPKHPKGAQGHVRVRGPCKLSEDLPDDRIRAAVHTHSFESNWT